MTEVDVLVVNYLTGDLTRKAVASVQGAGIGVHVWDNSGELLADPIPLAGAALHGDGVNDYFAAPNNALFRITDAPFVLLLNPDVEVSAADVHRLRDRLAGDHTAWGAAPRLVGPDGADQNYLRRLPTLRRLLVDRLPPLRLLLRRAHAAYYCRDIDLRADGVVEQPAAACLLLRRSAVGVELFDPGYRLFFNDTDLARRLNQRGRCLYVASVTATHVGGASIERSRRHRRAAIRREYDRSLLRYARRNIRGWWLLVPVVAVRMLAAGYDSGRRGHAA